MSKINYRTDSITMEQAQKAFDDYYKTNTTSDVGRFRAKLYDKMYQKKDNFTLREGEPGSARYLLPKGPKTFDFVGVDWFPEGEEFIVEKENPTKYKSKGATYKPGSDDNASEVYGPRLKDNQKLYCDYFRKEYEDNVSKTGKRDWLISHKKNKKSNKDDSVNIKKIPKELLKKPAVIKKIPKGLLKKPQVTKNNTNNEIIFWYNDIIFKIIYGRDPSKFTIIDNTTNELIFDNTLEILMNYLCILKIIISSNQINIINPEYKSEEYIKIFYTQLSDDDEDIDGSLYLNFKTGDVYFYNKYENKMNKFIGGDILYWFDQLPNFDISDIYDTEFIKDINDSTHFNIDSKKKIERTDTCIKSTYSNISISSSNLPKLGEPPEGLKIKSGIDTNISVISSDSKNTSSSESDNDSESNNDSDSESESNNDSDSEPGSNNDSDSEPESNNDSDSEPESNNDSDSESESNNDSDSEPESNNDSDNESESNNDPDNESGSNKDPDSDSIKQINDMLSSIKDKVLKESKDDSDKSQDNSNDSDGDSDGKETSVIKDYDKSIQESSFFDQLELENSDSSDESVSSHDSNSSNDSEKKDSISSETHALPVRKDVQLSQLGKSIKGNDNYLAIKQSGKIHVK